MWEKIKNISQQICDILELLVAVIVLVAVLAAIIMFLPELKEFIVEGASPETFLVFLEEVFTIVVGIEFLKMLCKPNSDNVIEVLVFLVARHMILGSSSALDNLLSIISIALLFVIRSYFHDKKRKRIAEKEEKAEHVSGEEKN